MSLFRRIPALVASALVMAFAVPGGLAQPNPYLPPVVEVPAFDHEKLALLEVERRATSIYEGTYGCRKAQTLVRRDCPRLQAT